MERKTGLTAEDIWAMFAETDKLQKENALQMDEVRNIQKRTTLQMEETDRRMQKLQEKLDKIGDKMDMTWGKVNGIDDNIGFHAERFFQDSLAKNLAFGGVKYDFAIPNLKCEGKKEGAEFDIVLVNGDSIAIIEVKNRIHPDFVENMAKERVDKFRRCFAGYKNYKAYLGIAGFSFCNAVLEKARECGIGIIRQVGDSVEMDAGVLKAY
jgi:hypothetical protein